MSKNRLEAFSDGVLAIVITIMVLELKVPHDANPAALLALAPIFVSYVISFVYVATYWNNHHHLLHAAKQVSGPVLWANMHLLFWLSLVPFSSGWMGENHFSEWTVFVYGVNLLACALAYSILVRTLIASDGPESLVAKAIGRDAKGYVSIAIYALALPLAFWLPLVATACYAVVALIWHVPDKRIERVLGM